MSDDEVARLLRGLKSKLPKNRDEQEVAGYADLLGRIFDNYKTLNLTESNILHFHSILLQFSIKDQSHKGKYKTQDNAVALRDDKGVERVLFNSTKPHLVRPEMEAIISWVNEQFEKGELHPILIIANFIFEFLAIHPFKDGNGRLSRALTNLLLLRSDYSYTPYVSLDEIIEDRKDAYYLALRTVQNNHKTDHEDITPWLNYLLDVLTTQAIKAKELMGTEKPEMLLSERQSQIFAVLKDGDLLGVAEIDNRLNGAVPKVTIKQALARLVSLRLIERFGQGRGVRYKKI